MKWLTSCYPRLSEEILPAPILSTISSRRKMVLARSLCSMLWRPTASMIERLDTARDQPSLWAFSSCRSVLYLLETDWVVGRGKKQNFLSKKISSVFSKIKKKIKHILWRQLLSNYPPSPPSGVNPGPIPIPTKWSIYMFMKRCRCMRHWSKT